MRLHFISGLPRSGSTLLAAILRQNPKFHAGMSSLAAPIMMRVLHAMSRGSEGSMLVNDEQRKDILRGVMDSYYKGRDGVVFDTSRMWCAKMPLVAELFPDAKVICCVRDVHWVMDSVERLVQANPLALSGIFDYQAGGTVFNRVERLASSEGLVGYAINALREAYYGPFADRLILLDYKALAKDPQNSLEMIYNFLGEEMFAHDYEHLDYEAEAFDEALGTPGLHRVFGPVRWTEQTPVLPPVLMQQYSRDAFWRNQQLNSKKVPVIMWVGQAE